MLYGGCLMLALRKYCVVFDRPNSGLVVILVRLAVDCGHGFNSRLKEGFLGYRKIKGLTDFHIVLLIVATFLDVQNFVGSNLRSNCDFEYSV